MADGSWTLAVLDETGVLTGFEIVHDEALWVRSKTRFPVPDNCDLAIGKRYRLVEWRPGKCRFEPIVHAKDAGAENNTDKIAFPQAAIVRAALGIGTGEDMTKLKEWLRSFDGAIS